MRTIITSIACICSLSLSAQIMDPNFGNDGISYVDNTNEISKLIRNPDGTIISAGSIIDPGGGYHIALTKHSAGGNLDMNFGTGGLTTTELTYSDIVMDLKLQTDGKILVAGSTYTGQDSPGGFPIFHAFVIRYHANGMIDSSFATNGIFLVTTSDDNQFNAVILQNDQSMLLIGNTEARATITKLTSSGAVDTSFGTSGIKFLSDYSTFFFINIGAIRMNDGSILFYGMDGTDINNSKSSCFKVDSQGDFVTAFGQNGVASIDIDVSGASTEILSNAHELASGKIILGGSATDKAILRINADGTLDSTFAVNGILNHTLPYKDMLVQPNGKIIVGGSSLISTNNYGFSISRFNSDGTIDLTFNSTGTFEADLTERSDILSSMILTGTERLLVGGGMKPVDFNSVFALAQIDMNESLGLASTGSDEFSIYPNPFSDKVTVSIKNESVTAVQLTDAMGRIIQNYPVSKHSELSLEYLEAGVYHLVFTNNRQEVISKKLIKQ